MSGEKPEDNKEITKVEEQEPAVVSVSEPPSSKKTAEKPSSKPADKPKKSSNVLGLLALLIAIVALLVVGWMYQQDQLNAAQTQNLSKSVTAELRSLTASQAEFNALISAQREALAQLRSDSSARLDALSRRSQGLEVTVQSLATVDRRDWLLAEAEYLLRLANQRAQLSRDPRSAARLLSSADEILRDLDDAALHPVRAELAKEIGALQRSAELDVEGNYLALQALALEAEKLKIYKAPSYEPVVVEQEQSGWQQRLEGGITAAWEKLRSYIRIRHHEQNFRAQLAPEQEAALRASLQLMFEQAQLALLANRPALYQRALEKSAAWLNRYYQLDEHRDALLEQITTLAAVPVGTEIADISASMASLKEYIKSNRWQKEARQ
ncbi:Protein HemX [Zhongshania aliphaticivorans]|uniref:Protein HemX n=1 Tax=Zhongshania aliphaticivorans TaxID=1470434 RepID=A0A5S9QAD2_9GAMM|nr:uroporphyrinogen-III C-methyltransferase [Zhongshania aliphaticivorans]CAA0102370.1 Protein HemX [Zhongshania aliphaticivorans]CAA0114363.1 Protein HemX [Zhongshania aliphaticivorans]